MPKGVREMSKPNSGIHDQFQPGKEVLCLDLLRQQVADLEAALAPGSDWDAQITEAQRSVYRLRAARKAAQRQLDRLQRALIELPKVSL